VPGKVTHVSSEDASWKPAAGRLY